MSQREIWFESAGARLLALELGGGVPLVFLHGGLADHRAGLFRVGALAAQHRVITPDLRGSGRSRYHGPLSWDLLAEDVAVLLDALGIDRAVVGGVSAGSAVSLRFALRYPERTLGLICMSPVYPGTARGLTEAQALAFRDMHALGERVVSEGVAVLEPLYERLPEAIRERALEMLRSFDAASVATTLRFLASGEQPFDQLPELAAIAAPVLLVPGTDPEHPAEVASLYAQQLRHGTVIDADSGELIERMDRFVRAVALS